MGAERAGIIVVRDGRLALVERHRHGRRYWVLPGGSIEGSETIEQAAQREGEEELGAPISLGSLRVRIDHRKEDGFIQRQWYFDATVNTDKVRLVGPELNHGTDRGTYESVWMDFNLLDPRTCLPSAVARLVASNRGRWPATVIEIDET